jgi:hypothetical protein
LRARMLSSYSSRSGMQQHTKLTVNVKAVRRQK